MHTYKHTQHVQRTTQDNDSHTDSLRQQLRAMAACFAADSGVRKELEGVAEGPGPGLFEMVSVCVCVYAYALMRVYVCALLLTVE